MFFTYRSNFFLKAKRNIKGLFWAICSTDFSSQLLHFQEFNKRSYGWVPFWFSLKRSFFSGGCHYYLTLCRLNIRLSWESHKCLVLSGAGKQVLGVFLVKLQIPCSSRYLQTALWTLGFLFYHLLTLYFYIFGFWSLLSCVYTSLPSVKSPV